LKETLGELPVVQNAILDGEVVCLDHNGVSQFNELMSRKGKPVFYAFDLLWLNDEDIRKLPLIERKQRLYELIQRSQCHAIIYAQHLEHQGVGFFEEICARDLEGIVAKHKRGIYKSNGLGWKKIKNPKYSQAEGRHDLFKP
jgi:bifunctional non-homologous end joining protein LigD